MQWLMYDKATLKRFILNCRKDLLQSQKVEPVDTDDFFNLGTVPDTDMMDHINFEDNILLTELEATIDKVGTDKEFYIFYMLVKSRCNYHI